MSGSHGSGRGIEVYGLVSGSGGAVERGLRQGPTQLETAGNGTNPEALQFARIGSDGDGNGGRQASPCDKTSGVMIQACYQATAVLFLIAVWQPRGFFFESAETKARRAGLSYDESAVFE